MRSRAMGPIEDGRRRLTPAAAAVVEDSARFGFALYRHLRAAEGNLLFSPYSIATALTLAYAGARGATATQMAEALHLRIEGEELHTGAAEVREHLNSAGATGDMRLDTANVLWPAAYLGLLDAYVALAEGTYGAQVTALDYGRSDEAAAAINHWVAERTGGRIQDLVAPGMFDPSTLLVLTNAIYFKGTWAKKFDPQRTELAPFYVTPAEVIEAPLMMQVEELGYVQNDLLQMVEMPYVGSLSMLVLLPRSAGDLHLIEDHLNLGNLNGWAAAMRPWKVTLLLPRFRMEAMCSLDTALRALRMVDAFGAQADFSGICPLQAYISAILHKAFVAVNEEGTEAAAATAVVMTRMMAPQRAVMRVDRPFLFLIRENVTGSILFVGRVVRPVG